MKFGNYLKANISSPWRLEYIQYDLLKLDLKNRQLDHPWNDQDEAAFIQLFTNERNKVIQFIHTFCQQLTTRIKYSEHLLRNARKENQPTAQDIRRSQLPPVKDSTAEFLNNLDDTLIEILFDIHDFSNYIRLNHIGFEKILKKHKKWTRIDHKDKTLPAFSSYHYDIASLETKHNHSFYIQVSRLRYQCHQEVYKANHLPPEEHFVPLTIPEKRIKKYWVHRDHISEVTAILCMHSYIDSVKSNKKEDMHNASMTNVYFDSDFMDIYSDRIESKKSVQSVKCKRYGSLKSNSIYFENEVHNTFYSGEVLTKLRFMVEEQHFGDFCKGAYVVPSTDDNTLDEHNKESKSAENNCNILARETQNTIISRHLKPILQCGYSRLTFKLPGDTDRLSVTLDTDIMFSQYVDLQPGLSLNGSTSDEDQKPRESCTFPYAVLEVKLSTDVQLDDPSLYWLNAFTQKSKLVHEVPKFSKHLQGIYQLFSSDHNAKKATSMSTVVQEAPPSWKGLFQKGISASGSHDGLSRSRSLRPLLNGKKFRALIPYCNSKKEPVPAIPQNYYDSTLRSSEGRSLQTSFSTHMSPNRGIARSAVVVQNDNPKVVLDMNEKTEMLSPGLENSIKASSSYSGGSPANLWSNNNSTGNLILDQDGNPIVYKNQSHQAFAYNYTKMDQDLEKGQKKKKKNIKNKSVIKLEPKVFFANERTFISWLQFCALLLTVSLNLLNFGDRISRICGAVFLFISMLLAIYALGRFQYRAWQLRSPNIKGRFDDIYGPAVLCILIVAALVINFWLRFRYLPDNNQSNTYLQANTSSSNM